MRYTCALILFLFFHITLHAQNDCPDAIIVCGDASYRGLNATGIGVQELELTNPCRSVEHNSLWLKILIRDGGTLGFILTPDSPALVIDFDFWIFGPNVDCGNIGQAVRCSTTNPLQSGTPHNLTGMNDISTDVAEGPGTNGNSFINWMTVQDDETYYLIIDRPVGSSDFSLQWTGTATFHDLPVFNNPDDIPLDMEQCDLDGVNDNSTVFDITTYADMFIGAQTDVVLTYHDNSNDMTTGENPLNNPSSFANTSNPQTVFLRMTNTITGCYETLTFDVAIGANLLAGQPEDLLLCDVDGNGLQQFDLSENDALVKNGAENILVTYYASEEDAENKTNALPSVYQNTTPYGTQIIWARLGNATRCSGNNIRPFTITVYPLPIFNNPQGLPTKIEKCDSDGVDNHSTAFNLAQHVPMFTGTQQNMAFTYHLTDGDAIAGTNPITNPSAFANTSNPQAIYVRMINVLTGCFETEIFEIEVINPIVAGAPADLFLCDYDENGVQQFDLSQNDAAIKNDAAGTMVTYYLSQQDAENDINPISSNYRNETPYVSQTIWGRLENRTGCFGYDIKPFTINILELPDFDYSLKIIDFTANSNSIKIIMAAESTYEYSIDGSNYSDNTLFDNLIPGIYTVYIRSKDGCKLITKDVVILNYPKFFTPNNDSYNELWTISYLYFMPDAIVTIFDRYGKALTRFHGKDPGWDGTYNGHNLPSTDYWFVLEFKNGRIVKGHFSMLR